MLTKIARRGRRIGLAALALPLAASLAACDMDGLLDVDDPGIATEEDLANPGSLGVLVAGAVADFQVAYSGNGDAGPGDDGFLTAVALFTDEMHASGSFPTRIATDRRAQLAPAQGNTTDQVYRNLHRARRSAMTAAAAVRRVAGADDPRIAELTALEAFTYVALAEGFCGAVPFGEIVDGRRVPGTPLSTAAMLDSAIVRFDAALAVAPGDGLALVGKGRALLGLGRVEEAAAVVAQVPSAFVYRIEHSSNSDRQYNSVFELQNAGRYSVSDAEGGGIAFRAAGDPRLPWEAADIAGYDGQTPLFFDLRYPDYDADVPLATGVEARLIEAEAALASGDVAGWLAALNDLRGGLAPLMRGAFDGWDTSVESVGRTGLESLQDPGTEAARLDLMFEERAFWLYTTGHRLGDLRRLVRQYGRATDGVFPSGAYHKGGAYGSDVAFPLDYTETVPGCDVGEA